MLVVLDYTNAAYDTDANGKDITMPIFRNAVCGVMAAAPLVLAAPVFADEVKTASLAFENRWVDIRFNTPDKTKKIEGGQALAADAAKLAAQHPDRVEPVVWEAMGLLIEGEVTRNLSSLKTVERAKALLEKAEAMDPTGMDALVHTTLGSLYYEVPGWPIAFGDNKKADAYLKKALEIDPDGMDSNYFYGDALLQRGKRGEALPYLEKAMNAPVRPDHEAADTKRKLDIQEALDKARQAR
jgi:tetratricopeptide (TPR) repeat protein